MHSPDEGAANRNIYYATMLGLDMGLFYKRRDYSVVVNGRNPIVAHEYMGESVEGKDVLIADDILATGDSMLDLARELKRRKCGRIFMATTFAMFTNGIEVFNQAYKEGLFDYILATNLNYLRPELRQQPWFIEVDMSKYIALIIATLNHDRSISPLLNPMQRIPEPAGPSPRRADRKRSEVISHNFKAVVSCKHWKRLLLFIVVLFLSKSVLGILHL